MRIVDFLLTCCCHAAGAGSDNDSDIVTRRGVVLYDFAAASLACLLHLPDLFLLHSADFELGCCCCCAAGAGSDDDGDVVTRRGVVLYDAQC
jgi:hypothetical protein